MILASEPRLPLTPVWVLYKTRESARTYTCPSSVQVCVFYSRLQNSASLHAPRPRVGAEHVVQLYGAGNIDNILYEGCAFCRLYM